MWHQVRVRGGCGHLHSPLTVFTHRYSLFCACFLTKCLSTTPWSAPIRASAPLFSLYSPPLPSAAVPSLPAHWKRSAGSASPKDEVSCQHPRAAHLALALRLTEWTGAAITPVSQVFPSLRSNTPSHAPSLVKVFARSLPSHTAHAILC